MKSGVFLWVILGVILAGMAMAVFYSWRDGRVDQPLHTGTLAYDYHWPSSDTSQVETIVKPVAHSGTFHGGLRDYEITVKNEAFSVRLSIRGVQVDSARILEARFHGQTQVTVWRDRIVTTPQTPGLTISYTPQANFQAPREKIIEAEILAGAYLLPPYSPIIAAGVCLKRLPLVGKLPPVTLGVGWFGTAPGVYVSLRL